MFSEQRSHPDDPQSMGLGWKRTTLETGDEMIWHDGGPAEGIGALVALVPAKKIGIALAGNSTGFGSPATVPAAVDIINRYLEETGRGGGKADTVNKSRVGTNKAVDGRYIAFSRLAEVRKGGTELRIEGFKFDLLPDDGRKYRVSHWLDRIDYR